MPNEFKARNGVITPVLQSTATTGTAPLVVASTTRVSNLNVATAGTADTLTTARTINGTSFNGSANITITANTPNTLTMGVSGTGLSGSATFNGGSATTFTVTSNATSANTASAVVARDGSGNFSAGTITAALSGNATTATTLQTARTIWGQNFNGSGNVDGTLTVGSSGNLTFSGTAQRITGDMSNATIANRLAFQTSTANANTSLLFLPNGSGSQSQIQLFNNSDPTNAARIQIAAGTTEMQIFSSITGTGTYLPMTFHTGGSERVRIDTSGNVGIGGVAAGGAYKLDVIANSTNGDGAFIRVINNNTSSTSASGLTTQNGVGTVAQLQTFNTDAILNVVSNSSLQIRTNNTERMRIDSSGNVGIGTTSPSGNLQVSAANPRIRFSNSAGTASTLLFGADSGTAWLGAETNAPLYFITNNAERMRIDSSGNVGIGASPSYTLDVNVASATFRVRDASGGNDFGIKSVAGPVSLAGSRANTAIGFMTNDTERMRIDSSGNVAIGTSSPASKLDVYTASGTVTQYVRSAGSTGTDIANIYTLAGNTYVQTVAYGSGYTYDISNASVVHQIGTYANSPVTFVTNSAERVRIDATGRLLVGTSGGIANSAGQIEHIQLVGTGGASSAIGAHSSSDTAPANIRQYRSRAGTTSIQAGDSLGANAWFGYTNAWKESAVRIIAIAETVSSNNIGGKFEFRTSDGTGATDAVRFTIGPTGNITSSDLADAVGYKGVPINSQSAAYTLVMGDQGKAILHPSSDNAARTFTIPANSSVAFPVGTVITFINRVNTVTIAITTDTMVLAGAGSTGSRTLAANGVATAIKIAATEWIISGNGLT